MMQPQAIPFSPLDDDNQSHLWLLVPAHNEESRLGASLVQYRMALSNRDRIVIIVNGCHDRTEEVARRAAGEDDRLIVIVDHQKIGKGGALIAGYKFVGDHAINRRRRGLHRRRCRGRRRRARPVLYRRSARRTPSGLHVGTIQPLNFGDSLLCAS